MTEPRGSEKKPTLPYGWIVKQSSTYPDRVYFFNTVTGASAWDPPELLRDAGNGAPQPGNTTVQPPLDMVTPPIQPQLKRKNLQNPSQDASGISAVTSFQNRNPQLHERRPQLHEQPSQLHERPLQLQERPPQLHERPPQLHNQPPIQFPIHKNRKHNLSDFGNVFVPNTVKQDPTRSGPNKRNVVNQQTSVNRAPPRFKDLHNYSSQTGNVILPDYVDVPEVFNEENKRRKNKNNQQGNKNQNQTIPHLSQDRGKVKKKKKSKSKKGKKNSTLLQNGPHPHFAQGQADLRQRAVALQGNPQTKGTPLPAESLRKRESIEINPAYQLLEGEDIMGNFSPIVDDEYGSDLEESTESSPVSEISKGQSLTPSGGSQNQNLQSPISSDFIGLPGSPSLRPTHEPIPKTPATLSCDTRQVKFQDNDKPLSWGNLRQRRTLLENPKTKPLDMLSPGQIGPIPNLMSMNFGRFNHVWSRTSAGIKSRLTFNKRSPSSNQCYTPIEVRQECLGRYQDPPQTVTSGFPPKKFLEPQKGKSSQGKISPIKFNRKEEFRDKEISVNSLSRQTSEKRKLEIDDTKRTSTKKRVIALDDKRVELADSYDENIPSVKKNPKLTLTIAKSDDSKKLINDPLNLQKKTSRFSFSSKSDISEGKSKDLSPISKKLLKASKKKRVNLKRIPVEGHSEGVPVTEKLSETVEKKDVGVDFRELAHINDTYKYASIQSWVNKIEDPVPPSSSPDTTHSSLSVGSTLSEFKIPIETVSAGHEHPEHGPTHLVKDFSDSGYSTSTLVTGLNAPVKVSPETREIVGMEVDMEQVKTQPDCELAGSSLPPKPPDQLQQVRSSMSNSNDSPEHYQGKLTEEFYDTMDVDMTEQSSVDNQACKLFIIVDTNILIHHLLYLEELRDTSIKGFGRPILVIPWVVLQELDAMKNNDQKFPNKAWTSQRKARAPVRFLFQCFKSKHPRVIGQSSKEAKKSSSQLDVECNDDRVLQCCLQWKDKYMNSQVILLSEDINLISKSTVSNIKAFNKKDLLPGLESLISDGFVSEDPELETSKKDNVSLPVPSTPELPATPKSFITEVTPDIKSAFKEKRETALQLADEMVCELKTILKNILAIVLETEMKSVYDDLWTEIVFRKPPWTLTTILECYEKHWIAVFGDLLQRKTESCVRQLSKHFKEGTGYGNNVRQVCSLLDNSVNILQNLPSKNNYSMMAKKPLSELRQLKELCTKILNNRVQLSDVPSLDVYLGRPTTVTKQITSPIHDSSLEGSQAGKDAEDTSSTPSSLNNNLTEADSILVMEKFNKTWEAINSFVEEMKGQVSAGALEVVCTQVSQRLPVLRQVKKNFHSALSVKRSKVRERSSQIAELCSSLNTLVTTNNNNSENLEVEKLIQFFSIKSNRPLLQAGLKQLDGMVLDLYNCVKKNLR